MPLIKMTGLVNNKHSPVGGLQSSLSSGISRVSRICLIIATISSRDRENNSGLGRGFGGFGLSICICGATLASNANVASNMCEKPSLVVTSRGCDKLKFVGHKAKVSAAPMSTDRKRDPLAVFGIKYPNSFATER